MSYSKKVKSDFDLDYCKNSIKTFAGQKESMLETFKKGKVPGSKTYMRDIDNIQCNGYRNKLWSWRPGELNLWTGYNNEGKSQALIFLCVLKAINENWKFAFFSPENYPPDEFFDDIIHTMLGKTTDKNHKSFDMTEREYLDAFERIKGNFFFVYPEDKEGRPDFSIENIEKIFEYLIFEENVKAVVVDPYLKIRHEMMSGEQEHLYASRFMMDRINFTRKQNVSYHLVMHQTTPRKNTDGNYPPPNSYAIKGGGTFADSADNCLIVWRPLRGTDPTSTLVTIKSDKIKKQKLVGMPHEIEIDFDRQKNRYVSLDGYDYFSGNSKLIVPEHYSEPKFKSNGLSDFDFPDDRNNKPNPF
jgi:twinkle protein